MLADTQAAHSIGGFKVGVGFAFRKCRDCLATKEMMSTMVIFFYYATTLIIAGNFCQDNLFNYLLVNFLSCVKCLHRIIKMVFLQ